MSEKTQIIFIAISLFIQGIVIFNIIKQNNQLKNNQEVMRKFINKKLGDKTNDNKNTNAHNTEEE